MAQNCVHTSLHFNVRFSTDLLDTRTRSAASDSLWRRGAHSRLAERSQAGRREPRALPNERMEHGSVSLDDSRPPREPRRASGRFGRRRTLSTNRRTVPEPNGRRSGASLSRAAVGAADVLIQFTALQTTISAKLHPFDLSLIAFSADRNARHFISLSEYRLFRRNANGIRVESRWTACRPLQQADGLCREFRLRFFPPKMNNRSINL